MLNMLMSGGICVRKFFIFFSVSFVVFLPLGIAGQIGSEVSAPIAILINADTGKILYERNAHRPCLPASTTKVATALYALHKKPAELNAICIASHDAVAMVPISTRRMSGKHPSYRLEYGGTQMGIRAKEELDFKTLLSGLMISSANDAANVIAEFVSGSVPLFVKEMNAYLQEIGCINTHFRNPHGLPDPHHRTTAYDLAHMTYVAMKNPTFCEIVKTERFVRPSTSKQPEEFSRAHRNALLNPRSPHYYPYAVGVKTGWTISAGYNLVAAAKKGDRFLIAVVCNCEEQGKQYKNVIHLFESAFNEPKLTRKLLTKEHDLFHRVVQGAVERVDAVLKQDVEVSYYPSEESQYTAKVHWLERSLPISAGDEVGHVMIYNQDHALQSKIPLLAAKTVNPTLSYKCSYVFRQCAQVIKAYAQLFGVLMGILLLSCAFWVYRKCQRKES